MKTKHPHARSLFAAVLAVAALMMGSANAQLELDPKIPRLVSLRLRLGIDIETFNARYGSVTERAIDSRAIYLVRIDDPKESEEEFSDRVSGDVVWAEPTYFADGPEGSGRNFYCLILPDPTLYNNQPAWGQINLDAAHLVSTGDGITIAIVDTGLDVTHREMKGRVLDGGWNFVEGNDDISDVGDGKDNDGDGDIDELTGHGTHMAGVIVKIAPDAMILPIKVLDSDGNTDTFMVAQGIFHAIDQGVDVINLSIGSTYDALPVEDALDEARDAGIVVTAAAGNVDTEDPLWEFPALREEVLGVVAVDEDDIKAGFTNVNVLFDLSAPGVGIWSTIPDDLYADLDGTSPATAMVSGAAALLLGSHPEWPRARERVTNTHMILQSSAFDIDHLNPDFLNRLGAGRLDAGAALDQDLGFAPPLLYPTGANPSGVAIGDLNGDGWPDLAVSNEDSNDVAVLINNGDGTFTAAAHYAVGSAPTAIVSVDLNGDQLRDLAVANGDAGSVSILINNGDGTFAPARNYATGAGPNAIIAANFDGDGDIDLATADDDSNTVSILRNDGTGVFTRIGAYAVGQRPRDLVAARLNADARPDLAVVSRNSDDLHVLINRGDGTFNTPVRYMVGGDPRAVTALDANGDGSVDLVSANSDTRDLSVLDNRGDGTFDAARSLPLFGNRSADALVQADFNGDQLPDLAVLNGDPPGALTSLVFGDGAGGFPAKFDIAILGVPEDLDAADLNGDREADVAVVDSEAAGVWVILNLRPGDVNCDGSINAFDIEPFLLALFDPEEYARQHSNCDRRRADVNGDGSINAFDIEPFLQLLFGG